MAIKILFYQFSIAFIVGMEDWIDCGTYFLNKHPQHSLGWASARSGRLTASLFGTFVIPRYKNPQQIADEMLGFRTEKFHPEAIERMNHGTETESVARKWYCKTYNVTVSETGIAVPKWNDRIGCSPDGLVGDDGLLEIKAPKKMYWPLEYKTEGIPLETSVTFGINSYLAPKNEKDAYEACPIYLKSPHIPITHYAQMQGCMAIMGRKWCDYVVYATDSGKVYVERVYYDNNFWLYTYDKILTFLTKTLPERKEQLIKDGKLEVIPF
jgi:hypothetical protein